jgi:hypothetical protein
MESSEQLCAELLWMEQMVASVRKRTGPSEGERKAMNKSKHAQGTQVTTRTTTLSPAEEKVVRMRHGLRAPDDLILERLGAGNPELEAKIAEMEAKVLRAVGTRNNPVKRRIVQALKDKRR